MASSEVTVLRRPESSRTLFEAQAETIQAFVLQNYRELAANSEDDSVRLQATDRLADRVLGAVPRGNAGMQAKVFNFSFSKPDSSTESLISNLEEVTVTTVEEDE